MPRQSDARQEMIKSAAQLIREYGVQGTSFSDVLSHSGAPRGSIYHHFPDGKTQLAAEATQWAGEYIVAGTAAALADGDPVSAIATFGRWWTTTLESSDYQAGCVIAAAALEGEREPTVHAAAAAAFATWEDVFRDALQEHGVSAVRARSLATLVIAAIEGAVILARATQTTTPLSRVTHELQRIVADEIESDPDSR